MEEVTAGAAPPSGAAHPGAGHRDTCEHLAPLFTEHRGLAPDDPRRRELRARLITGYRPVARHIARRYAYQWDQRDDLEQVATLGLILAVDRFDPDRGADFLAYAVPTITGEVLRHFRDRSAAIRIPRPLQELQGRIHAAAAELGQRLGRAPRPSELAAALQIDLATVLDGLAAMEAKSTSSLEESPADDDSAPSNRPRHEAALGRLEPRLELIEQRESLRPLLQSLPEREQTILLLRFFHGQTQSQIAAQLEMSQMHVSRLLTRTLAALRHRLAADRDAGRLSPRR